MTTSEYSSDKPIKKPSEDSFNRAEFAKQLARTILSKGLNEGYVIGLYSEWGYGKTSTLNMVEEELKKNKNVVLIKFNPWLFTDQSSMISGLFHTLADALDKKLTNKKEKVGDALKKYSSFLAPIPVGGVAEAGGALGKWLSNASLDELKQRIEKIIADSNKRLIVFIDDVDRLDKDELFQLFKLIKIAVDFKNVVYLIAFDEKVVSDALGQRYLGGNESGQSFIEKIIQIPLHLPMISQRTLDHYVLSGIDEILQAYGIEIDQDEVNRFRLVFDEQIAGKLRTPRMANRYLNSLKFVLPLAGDEINPVDLLILESVRMLYPEEYKKLRLMKRQLTGGERDGFLDEKDVRAQIKHEVDEAVGTNKKLVRVLTELFPAVDNAFKEHGGSYVDNKNLKRQKRAASPDYFDRYFTYGIPMGDVSDTAILDALHSKKSAEIAEKLQLLMSSSDQDKIVGKLRDYEDDVQNTQEVVRALIKISVDMAEPAASGFRDTPLEELAKMMLILIKKLPSTEKIDFTSEVINEISNLDQLSYLLRWINITSDEKREDKIFSSGEKDKLLDIAVQRIIKDAQTTPLYKSEYRLAHYHYHTWADTKGAEEVIKHLNKSVTSFGDVCDFLTRYASIWYGSGPARRGDIEPATYKFMCKIVDPEHLLGIIKKHDSKLANVKEFTNYPDKVNIVGNESDPRFRETLVKQFVFTHSEAKSDTANKPAE